MEELLHLGEELLAREHEQQYQEQSRNHATRDRERRLAHQSCYEQNEWHHAEHEIEQQILCVTLHESITEYRHEPRR